VRKLRCSDASLYTGITTDVGRRLAQHNSARAASKYTRSRQPLELVYYEKLESRGKALRRELEIKKLKAVAKAGLVIAAADNPAYHGEGPEISREAIASLTNR